MPADGSLHVAAASSLVSAGRADKQNTADPVALNNRHSFLTVPEAGSPQSRCREPSACRERCVRELTRPVAGVCVQSEHCRVSACEDTDPTEAPACRVPTAHSRDSAPRSSPKRPRPKKPPLLGLPTARNRSARRQPSAGHQ